MRKCDELTNPRSCMSRAHDSEMVFVLLGRDVAAPAAIRFWVGERLERGKNVPDDPQIIDALATAAAMEEDQRRAKVSPSGV